MKYTAAELKDRGNIKWTAMMLSEHRVELFKLQEVQEDVDPPDHDLDRLCDIAELLARAMHQSLIVKVRYWRDKRNHEVIGMVKKMDPIMKAVLVMVEEDDSRWVEARYKLMWRCGDNMKEGNDGMKVINKITGETITLSNWRAKRYWELAYPIALKIIEKRKQLKILDQDNEIVGRD